MHTDLRVGWWGEALAVQHCRRLIASALHDNRRAVGEKSASIRGSSLDHSARGDLLHRPFPDPTGMGLIRMEEVRRARPDVWCRVLFDPVRRMGTGLPGPAPVLALCIPELLERVQQIEDPLHPPLGACAGNRAPPDRLGGQAPAGGAKDSVGSLPPMRLRPARHARPMPRMRDRAARPVRKICRPAAGPACAAGHRTLRGGERRTLRAPALTAPAGGPVFVTGEAG